MQGGVISFRSPQHVYSGGGLACEVDRGNGLVFSVFGSVVRIGEFCGFIHLDAGVPFFESYGIVTEQARLVKTVKVIFGLAL